MTSRTRRSGLGIADWLPLIVVGAGPAGLSASRALTDAGCDHVVLERGRVGWSWRTQRWDSFRLNTPGWMNRAAAGHLAVAAGAFASAETLVHALECMADGLPIMEGVTVIGAERNSDVWRLETTRGTFASSELVVASGFQNVPRVPLYADDLPPDIKQLHVADYRRPSDVAGSVLVVGGGQSGAQIADELVDAGRHVYLSTSRVGRVPRRHRGRDAFEWMLETGQLDLRTEAAEPTTVAATPPQISGAHGGRTVSYQELARRGTTLVGRVLGWNGRAFDLSQVVGSNIRFADDASRRLRARWDAHAAKASHSDDDDFADAAAPHLYDLRGPATLDLAAAGIETIIWATGFRPSTQWLPPDALDVDHRPLLPRLHIIGAPWLTHRSSANLYGIAADAELLARTVAASPVLAAA